MNNLFEDIRSRIPESPTWYDENGTPRYGQFTPLMAPVFCVQQVCLMEVGCQGCPELFRVQISCDKAFPNGLAHEILTREIGYGDPPAHNCLGDTMSSIRLRILEYWERPNGGAPFHRFPELEIDIKSED